MYKRYRSSKHAPAEPRSARHAGGPAHGRNPPSKAPRRRGRTKLLAAVCALACLALVGAAAGLLLSDETPSEGGWYDEAAAAGSYEGKSEEAVRADLEKAVAEGMMNISIASDVVASAQTGEAEVRIENIPANSVDQKVTLARADTGDVLYESDAIAPGNHVQTVHLEESLQPGTYDVLATFVGYDRETHEPVGTSAAEITLTVEA